MTVRKKKIRIAFISGIFLIAACTLAFLFYKGILLFNNPTKAQYPIRGVDVSSYQGDIDWEVLTNEDIQFAFIKATEGSSFVDPEFSNNYENASKTNIRIGAYHFFSFDSSGQTQAENYISVVEKKENMLPPVIDLEFYGDKAKNPPDTDETKTELKALLSQLEEYYGMKPIIYATEKTYKLYIADDFEEYGIWIRNVYSTPTLSDGRDWLFWQYTNRETLDGYEGSEDYIDMNVFNGTAEEFEQLGKE